MTEEQRKLADYIESEHIGRNMSNYNRTIERKAVRYYLMYYMKSRLSMNYREIAEMLGFYMEDGKGDHATAFHGIKQWGLRGNDDDFQALTAEVRFLFPVKGKSGYIADHPDRLLRSIGSMCEQMHIQSLGDRNDITIEEASELMGVSIPTFRLFAKRNRITLSKIVNKKHFYSKHEVVKHAGL